MSPYKSVETPSKSVAYTAVRLPLNIWALGIVSLLMDASSELVHSLLPIFMKNGLGVSIVVIGLVEGIAEATASITKVFSGALSDFIRKRKLLLVVGYGLAAITKPVFPLATSIEWVIGARFVDRVGKGIRGAPRDALIADITPPAMRGAAYGLRQALDSIGAFVGPGLAIIFMAVFADQLRPVFWVGVVPAFLAVTLLIFVVHEPARSAADVINQPAVSFVGVRQLELRYWLVVLLGAVFTLARFSEAFLILRAQNIGLAIGYVPLVMIIMNVFYAAAAYPAGIIADRVSRATILGAGLAVLVIADIVLAVATSTWGMLCGAAFWGLHMAFTQGLLSKLVADTAPAKLRGTAFGIFNLVTGAAMLAASLVAGALWDRIGPAATFFAGAGFAAIAAVGIVLFRTKVTSQPGNV